MRRILACLALLSAASAAVSEGSPIALSGGAVLAVEGPGIALQMVEVTDNRCPSMVACVWEGTKRIVLLVNPGSAGEQRLVLCNACEDGTPTAFAAGQRFVFAGLEPQVEVIEALGRPAVLTDYTGMVTVETVQ